jgi:phosphate transport system protein
MSRHLQHDLEAVEREILAMSAIVEDMIDKSCQALREMRADLVAHVYEQEALVDQREVEIEEECLKVLALHQPVAIDLRRTVMILKVNNDLERIADLAVNIAQCSERLAEHPDFTMPGGLQEMAKLSASMVRDVLNAFVQQSVELARGICARDAEVDQSEMAVNAKLAEIMRNDSRLIQPALECFSATRHVERIADHATNIAEDIIYLAEGEIARHRHE